MGTSSRYSAPTGGDWTRAKRDMTRWSKAGGSNPPQLENALHAYVSALGGARAASSSARGATSALQRLGAFLAGASTGGTTGATEQLGLGDLEGASIDEVLNELATAIAGDGESMDGTLARDATIDVLSELLSEVDTYEEFEALVVDGAMVERLLGQFLVEYLNRRVLQALGDRIHGNAGSDDAAFRLEVRIRDSIAALVSLDLSDIDVVAFDWEGAEGTQRVQRLLEEAFVVVGGEGL